MTVVFLTGRGHLGHWIYQESVEEQDYVGKRALRIHPGAAHFCKLLFIHGIELSSPDKEAEEGSPLKVEHESGVHTDW